MDSSFISTGPGLVWERINTFPNKPWFLCVCSTNLLKTRKNQGLFGKGLTLSQTSPGFLCVCMTSLLKTLWEKKKFFMKSNFSFSPVFSILLENFRTFSPNLKLLSANHFILKESNICCLEKQNFRQFYIFCKPQ